MNRRKQINFQLQTSEYNYLFFALNDLQINESHENDLIEDQLIIKLIHNFNWGSSNNTILNLDNYV